MSNLEDTLRQQVITRNKIIANLRAKLRAVKRCPGIDTTDQETAKTFREILDSDYRLPL